MAPNLRRRRLAADYSLLGGLRQHRCDKYIINGCLTTYGETIRLLLGRANLLR